MDTFIALLTAHLLSGFPLQPGALAERKREEAEIEAEDVLEIPQRQMQKYVHLLR